VYLNIDLYLNIDVYLNIDLYLNIDVCIGEHMYFVDKKSYKYCIFIDKNCQIKRIAKRNKRSNGENNHTGIFYS
jgi:hypothetical protein